MPEHDPGDPLPPGAARRERAWRRYRQLMSWMVIVAAVAVLLALLFLRYRSPHVPAAMVIATIAGVGLSVLLGTGLMGLVFVSNSSGIDDEASGEDGVDQH